MTRTEENLMFAAQQLGRLHKPFPPATEDARREVLHTLVDCSESRAHMISIVDKIASEEGDFPEPAAFRRVASESRSLRFLRNPDCLKCDASGHIIKAVENGYSFAKRCDCWAYREPLGWQREGSYQ